MPQRLVSDAQITGIGVVSSNVADEFILYGLVAWRISEFVDLG